MSLYKHKYVGLVIVTTLIFLYIYPLRFVFFPISTRVIMGLIGLILFIKSFRNPLWIQSKSILHLLFPLLGISFISFISLFLNGTNDNTFLIYPVSVLLIISASYFISKISNQLIPYSSVNLINILIYAVVIQNIFSVILFFNPALGIIIRSVLIENESTEAMLENTAGFRLNGIGIAFFGAGIINSVALILCAYKIRVNSNTVTHLLKWITFYVVIAITGIGMARTTFIGIGVSALIFIYTTKLFSSKIPISIVNSLKATSIFIIFIILVVWCIPSTLKTQLEDLGEFAFELFINYKQGGEVSSSSTNELLGMYEILPSSIETWLIGDGLWMDPHSSHYYMRTDVGYMRLIFYFGLTGLTCYMLFQYRSVWYAIQRNNHELQGPLTLIFILCLILNLKGFTDIIAYSSLFFYSNRKS